MSPDPPREDSDSRDEDSLGNLRRFDGDLPEGAFDEFFLVPDAPYELDMENESDYTDSDEEEGNATNQLSLSSGANNATVLNNEENSEVFVACPEGEIIVQGQARGRYRLLIPFPDPVTTTEEFDDATNQTSLENPTSGGQNMNSTDRSVEMCANQSEVPLVSYTASTSSEEQSQTVEKREIELTDDKVETIKQAMKNFSLPSSSIPKWAAELSEDVWKKKLNDSISSKSNHSNFNAPLFEAKFDEG